jgi:dienelactone hydrolase
MVEAPGAVILPDVRGLHPFYEELTLRFSEAGVAALAIDYYGRTAGMGARGDDFNHEPTPNEPQTTASPTTRLPP